MTRKNASDLTRDRLLDEAEILFSSKGYNAVSIREITRAADCNLAAVNYHFDHKENLYIEVFRSRWQPRALRVFTFMKERLAAQETRSPAAAVEALAQAFLTGPLTDEERLRHFQLITRELCQPSRAFETIVNEAIRPLFKELYGLFSQCLPLNTGKEKLTLDILSIFGMVLYFNFARETIKRMTGRDYDEAFKAELVKQIVNFSLHGLDIDTEEPEP
jgi:AcrR family transcriptional regulator